VSRDHLAAILVPAAMLCVFGLLWAERLTGLWWAAPVAVVVGLFLAVTDRFGPPEWLAGLLALAGLGIAALYAMVFTATVPDPTSLAPAALGIGVGMAASRLYLRFGRSRTERPT
jgi:hypothetical protein